MAILAPTNDVILALIYYQAQTPFTCIFFFNLLGAHGMEIGLSLH